MCGTNKESIECTAQKTVCGDWVPWNWEDCNNCSKDVKDPCVTDWDEDCTCEECPEKLKDICIDEDCTCEECPEKLKDICIDEDCTCEECPEKLKDKCVKDEDCWNGIPDPWENCDSCAQDMKDSCVQPNPDPDVPGIVVNNCWNGEMDPWETCEECPEDCGWWVTGEECNSCPCEYVDFAANLTRGDTIRAKLWDISRPVFYNYSNTVAVENYLKIK